MFYCFKVGVRVGVGAEAGNVKNGNPDFIIFILVVTLRIKNEKPVPEPYTKNPE